MKLMHGLYYVSLNVTTGGKYMIKSNIGRKVPYKQQDVLKFTENIKVGFQIRMAQVDITSTTASTASETFNSVKYNCRKSWSHIVTGNKSYHITGIDAVSLPNLSAYRAFPRKRVEKTKCSLFPISTRYRTRLIGR